MTEVQMAILQVMDPKKSYRAGEIAKAVGTQAGGTGMALRKMEHDQLVESEFEYNSKGTRLHKVYRLSARGKIARRVERKVRMR